MVDTSDPRLAAFLEERLHTGKARGELTLIRKDGIRFQADVSSAIFTDKGGIQRTSMIVRDITERKLSEARLDESAEQARLIMSATTHWGYARYLEQFGARYLRKRWVNSGKIINSAGVSAGINMALFLISRLTDDDTARQVQLAIHYDPQPPFGKIDYDHLSTFLRLISGWMDLSAPFAARKPRQMLQQGL